MFRSILAIVVGLVTAMLPIIANFAFLNPLPPGTDLKDPASIIKAVETMPTVPLVMLLTSLAAGILPGSWLAAKIAARQYVLHSAAIGGFFLVVSVANLKVMKQPQWFEISNVAIILPVALVGGLLARRKVG